MPGLDDEKAMGLLALAWLFVSLLAMMRSVRRGTTLAEALAERWPETYEALGRPRPGYLDSSRRRRFAQFVGRREYEGLADASLVAEFEAFRASDARVVSSVLASGVAVVVLGLALRYLG